MRRLATIYAICVAEGGLEMILRRPASQGAAPMISTSIEGLDQYKSEADAICGTLGLRWTIEQFVRRGHGVNKVAAALTVEEAA